MANKNSASTVLIILSVLFPIVGWILYFVKKNDEPEAAKTYGQCGIAGFVLGLILNALL